MSNILVKYGFDLETCSQNHNCILDLINFLLLFLQFQRCFYGRLNRVPSWKLIVLTFIASYIICFFFLHPLLLFLAFLLTCKYYEYSTLIFLSYFTLSWIWSGFTTLCRSEANLVQGKSTIQSENLNGPKLGSPHSCLQGLENASRPLRLSNRLWSLPNLGQHVPGHFTVSSFFSTVQGPEHTPGSSGNTPAHQLPDQSSISIGLFRILTLQKASEPPSEPVTVADADEPTDDPPGDWLCEMIPISQTSFLDVGPGHSGDGTGAGSSAAAGPRRSTICRRKKKKQVVFHKPRRRRVTRSMEESSEESSENEEEENEDEGRD